MSHLNQRGRRSIFTVFFGALLLALALPVFSQPSPELDTATDTAAKNVVRLQQASDRLAGIRQSLIARRQKLKDLQQQLKVAPDEEAKKELLRAEKSNRIAIPQPKNRSYTPPLKAPWPKAEDFLWKFLE